jgi:nucleotide-binding universal stress UspA family protein
MRLVIAAVDGSAPAAAASRWAARLAVRCGAELLVASAWEPVQAEGTAEDFARRRDVAVRTLEEEWSAASRATGARVETVLVDGGPGALLALAEERGADLLVVGNRGDGGPAQLHLGSAAHQLVHHTARPLAIVAMPAAGRAPELLVLGVDGTESSAAAVDWCAANAPTLGARVLAVLAYEPFLEWVTDDDPRSWRRQAERHLEAWLVPLRAAGVAVEVVIVRDVHPAAAIAQIARERDADLVVVGGRPAGSIVKARHRGTTTQVVHQARRPVVLVPAPAHRGSAPAPTVAS